MGHKNRKIVEPYIKPMTNILFYIYLIMLHIINRFRKYYSNKGCKYCLILFLLIDFISVKVSKYILKHIALIAIAPLSFCYETVCRRFFNSLSFLRHL